MGTAAGWMNCHVLPSVELNLIKAKFIQGGRVNSQQPVSRMFVYIIRRLDKSPFCFIRSILSKYGSISKETLYGLHIPWMYVKCSEVRFVEFSSPNECDKILKIPNEQTEPTDYMANCSTDTILIIWYEPRWTTSEIFDVYACSIHRKKTRLNFASKTVHLDWYLNLTFEGHPRSKIFSPFESPYMTSYLISIDTFSLSRTVFEIFDFKGFRVWSWPLTFKGDPKSKIFPPFESPYMTSYSTPIDTFSLSRTVFEIFDFKVFRVWPWPLGVTRGQTYFHHLEAHLWLPIQLPLTLSLSCTVFEIFDFKVFRVWPWPLTFRGHLGSNIFSPFESPYMISYLTSIDTFYLYRTVFEIFDFKVFRVWPWPLTFRGHLRCKIFPLFESSYMTSYLTPIDTFSVSRTVFEIFDFKVFRVWPWPLTFRGHLRWKIFPLFESSYMTSYLTSIDTFSLSRNVFEIFDFKVFRVWPWPLTFGVTLGQKYFHHSKAHIWLFYPTSIDTFYLVPFLRYSTSKFLGFDLDLWPLGVTWGQTYCHHLKAHIWLPI